MPIEELQILMDRWLGRSISITDKERLRTYYLEVNGWDRHTCTTCPSFWWDVKQSLRYILLKNGIKTMEVQPKYILAEGVGEIRTFGSGTHYVMEGEPSPTTVILTDEVAERLLETNPGVKEQLIPNPAYVEQETGGTKLDVKLEIAKPAKKETAKAPTAKEKKAAKEAEEAEKLATVTPAPELVAPVISNEPETAEGSISQDVVIPVV